MISLKKQKENFSSFSLIAKRVNVSKVSQFYACLTFCCFQLTLIRAAVKPIDAQ